MRVLFAILILGGGLALTAVAKDAAGDALKDRTAACERGNVNRANDILDTRQAEDSLAEAQRINATQPILDCVATQERNFPVLLSQPEKYIQYVETLRRPIIEDGRIVGSTPFVYETEGGERQQVTDYRYYGEQ